MPDFFDYPESKLKKYGYHTLFYLPNFVNGSHYCMNGWKCTVNVILPIGFWVNSYPTFTSEFLSIKILTANEATIFWLLVS